MIYEILTLEVKKTSCTWNFSFKIAKDCVIQKENPC